MAMVVKNNMSATRTLNTLDKNEKTRNKSSTNAATGMKINSAQDDASGYSISERMRVRIRALDQANQNTQNDAALMKTAGGAVDNTVEILRALKEKAINAANDSNTDEDRLIIQKEAHQLIDQINDNALVQFNGKYLIDGSKNNAAVSTQTILLNQNLANATGITTGLTTLANRVGDSLEIQTGDRWEVSYVLNGTTHHTDGEVTSATCLYHLLRVDGTRYMLGDNTIQKNTPISDSRYNNSTQAARYGISTVVKDKFNQDIYSPDKERGIALLSAKLGTDNQLSGFTISITDVQGNVNKAANTALEFKLYQRAENKTEGGDKSLTFQIGSEANVAIKVALTDMRAKALGLQGSDGEKILFVPKENANAAINVFENALTMALDQSTSIGAIQQRLEYTSANLTTSSENVQAAESTIRDADMAKEMTDYTKSNILIQAAQTMLAQANQNSSAVLSLLQ